MTTEHRDTTKFMELCFWLKEWFKMHEVEINDTGIGHLSLAIEEKLEQAKREAIEEFCAFLKAPDTIATTLDANKEIFIRKLKGESLPCGIKEQG